ncbi:hypothetical protein OCK74_15010 [Chitinophagaceae bacterium LB-8]|uniref:Uncharacterized protein n=1 Tax=Paraflavisolibacter caeni TaxID=2982496 RepID=A0A9X2XW10_9BACT|nr:hypothetical protein [Paraflavisolibacter caeni]MCU7550429.1 hypothetical protein [Paraflavisolibacter caeni]
MSFNPTENNHVGAGYGFIPKGYYLHLGVDCKCRLVVIRGKVNKKQVTADAEQQAIIKAQKDDGEGGEKVLSFEGSIITGLVNGKPVTKATDTLYARGMAGLMAGGGTKKLSSARSVANLQTVNWQYNHPNNGIERRHRFIKWQTKTILDLRTLNLTHEHLLV